MAEPILLSLGMYITVPKPISTAYFMNPSFIAKQRLGKHIPVATNTGSNGIIVGRVCLWASLCILLLLLGKNSVKTFPLQGRIFWRLV
jgi:hypothetical protein